MRRERASKRARPSGLNSESAMSGQWWCRRAISAAGWRGRWGAMDEIARMRQHPAAACHCAPCRSHRRVGSVGLAAALLTSFATAQDMVSIDGSGEVRWLDAYAGTTTSIGSTPAGCIGLARDGQGQLWTLRYPALVRIDPNGPVATSVFPAFGWDLRGLCAAGGPFLWGIRQQLQRHAGARRHDDGNGDHDRRHGAEHHPRARRARWRALRLGCAAGPRHRRRCGPGSLPT